MKTNQKAPVLLTAVRTDETKFQKLCDPDNCWKNTTKDKNGNTIVIGHSYKGTRYVYYCPTHLATTWEGKQYLAELENQVNAILSTFNQQKMKKWEEQTKKVSTEKAE